MSAELMIIYGALITVLAGIVGYFLNKQINVIERLTDVVSALNTTVALLQQNQSNFATTDAEKHQVIESRFDSHSKKLHDYGIEITELKHEVGILKRETA